MNNAINDLLNLFRLWNLLAPFAAAGYDSYVVNAKTFGRQMLGKGMAGRSQTVSFVALDGPSRTLW